MLKGTLLKHPFVLGGLYWAPGPVLCGLYWALRICTLWPVLGTQDLYSVAYTGHPGPVLCDPSWAPRTWVLLSLCFHRRGSLQNQQLQRGPEMSLNIENWAGGIT